MNKLQLIFSTIIFSVSFSLIGCSPNYQPKSSPSLFETKIDAEKAAKNFNCIGAHRMGDKWMPCKIHTFNEEENNHKSHNGHHRDH